MLGDDQNFNLSRLHRRGDNMVGNLEITGLGGASGESKG